jgi:glucan endo-1,3-alpha-glucosidase
MNWNTCRVVAAALLMYLCLCPRASAQPKLVFALYMVCNRDYGGSVAGYEHDIQDAQAYGIDGFDLDCGDWNGGNYKADTAKIFQAAAALNSGFKLFFEAEGQSGDQIVNMVETYASNPYYYHYQGRPLLLDWAGNFHNGGRLGALSWWQSQVLGPLHAAGINVFFIPSFYCSNSSESPTYDQVLSDYNLWWNQIADGFNYFGAAGTPTQGSLLKSSEAFATVFHEHGKTVMSPVSPQYWGNKQKPERRYFEYGGGQGLTAQWESIIQVQHPEWVNMITWNDFDEATFFTPIDDVNNYWHYVAHTAPGFYQNRTGILKLNEYFIDWYKHYPSNTPPPPPGGVDNLYYIYRTSPKAVLADDKMGPVLGFAGDVEDDLYVTTILKKAATLQVTSGGVTSSYDLPKGLSTTGIPFHPGQQSFTLTRGRTILSGTGPAISASVPEYDFIYTSGWLHG